MVLYLFNYFPRGKGKAPKAVVPTDVQTSEQLREDLQTVRLMLLELEHLDAKSNFMHPYFGQLNLKQTKKFLALHTKHHLKIIDDILSRSELPYDENFMTTKEGMQNAINKSYNNKSLTPAILIKPKKGIDIEEF